MAEDRGSFFGTDFTDGHGYYLSFLKKSGTRFLETGCPPGGGQGSALQGPEDRFRGEGGQVQFGSGAANLKAKRDSVPPFLNYRFQSFTV